MNKLISTIDTILRTTPTVQQGLAVNYDNGSQTIDFFLSGRSVKQSFLELCKVPGIISDADLRHEIIDQLEKNDELAFYIKSNRDIYEKYFSNDLSGISAVAAGLIDLAQSLLATRKDDELEILFPTPSDLKEFGEILHDVNSALQIILRIVDPSAEIEFRGSEKGSVALLVAIKNAAAVAGVMLVMMKAIKTAVEAYKMLKGIKFLETELRLKKFDRAYEILVEESGEKTNLMLRDYAIKLLKEIDAYKEDEHEEIGRMAYAFRIFAKLFDKGVEITPALPNGEVYEKIKDVVPDYDSLEEVRALRGDLQSIPENFEDEK